MSQTFRDSAIGQWLRLLPGQNIVRYPEEDPAFKLPTEYLHPKPASMDQSYTQELRTPSLMKKGNREAEVPSQLITPIDSTSAEEAITMVTWYSEDDPDNPQNWSSKKKLSIGLLILVYTISVYIGSSMYTASIPDIISIFGVSETAAALGLALYVVGYGVGPLLFAPLSEIPSIGRNPPYIYTYIIFVALSIATVLIENFAGLLVLRFLLGFFGAPALANAGASYGDFFGPGQMPYVIALWGGGATLSPALGPLVAGFAVQAKDWRWSSWELLWFAGPTLIVVLACLPETSPDTILLRRAQRLRQLTGRTDLKSESEIRQAQLSPRHIAFDALIKPFEINILDPAVLFTTVYTALVYGLYYSFFETFPLVYRNIYGFNLGQLGLTFLSVLIGLIVGVVMYCAYFYYVGDPKMKKMTEVPPEARLWPGLVASFLIPVGLFIFAWTARKSIHWSVSLVGAGISMCGVFIIIQCMFIYLPFSYPRYSGSLFAANGFVRSTFAAGAVLFAGPMFARLGIDGGVSLLAGLTVLCVFGIYGMYFGGASLRRRSRFAGSG